MSKVVQAVNAMIANPEYIDRVTRGGHGELFFVYKRKYKWSMRRDADGEIFLYYYPGQQSLDQLARFDDDDWQDFADMVVYSSREIGTREAQSSFNELYTLLKERVFGINEVLDDIIKDDL